MESTLCLACASSLPLTTPNSYHTPCCGRIICASCLSKNPRLRQYNPCLSCLGGVGVISSALQSAKRGLQVNGVHEDDVFVLGDSDDEAEPPQYVGATQDDISPNSASCALGNGVKTEGLNLTNPWKSDDGEKGTPQRLDALSPATESRQQATGSRGPLLYWIKPGDTMSGISLKFGVDGRLLCRINQLSPSTLTTTPHLLHTRTTLTLPPTIRRDPSPPPADAEERLARRAQEQATKRLQFVTKELDPHIARTYVNLADGGDLDDDEFAREVKEEGKSERSKLSLEDRAVDSYLEDEAWEARERASGRVPSIQPFPFFGDQNSSRGSYTGLSGIQRGTPYEKTSPWSLFWPKRSPFP